MSVPKELLSLMAGGGGEKTSAGPNPVAAAAPGNAAPGGGPLTTPQPKEGATQAAMIDISMVGKLLTKSLDAFGVLSKEGKAINQMLGILTKTFGADMNKSDQLIPAELLQLVQGIAGAGGGSPTEKAMGAIPPTQPAMQAAPAA